MHITSPRFRLVSLRRPVRIVFGCLASMLPTGAFAADLEGSTPIQPSQADLQPPNARGSALATGAAVVPGVFIHGAGHFTLGERQSAYRLLAMEGVGLAGVIGGIGTLAAVGGSEKFAFVYVPMTVTGLGLFTISFLADVIGAAHGTAPWAEPTILSGMTVRTGYVGLFGSKHSFRHLGELSAEWRTDQLVLDGRATLHPQGDFAGYGILAGWKLWAPANEPVTRLGFYSELAHQDFRQEGFAMTTFRAFAQLRWNLGDLVATMQNAWILGRMGWGFDAFHFDGTSEDDDGLPFLVSDIGIGLMATSWVELELSYRHRKGELPGGMSLSDGLSGFAGMLELRSRVELGKGWALAPGARLGTGVMPWLHLESRLF